MGHCQKLTAVEVEAAAVVYSAQHVALFCSLEKQNFHAVLKAGNITCHNKYIRVMMALGE